MALAQKVTIVNGGGGGISGVTAATGALAIAPAPYDSNLVNHPAANTQAVITFAATAGKRWVITEMVFSIATLGFSAAVLQDIQILDDATEIWESRLSIPAMAAAGSAIDRLALSNLAIAGSVGTAVKVQFTSAAGAATYETVSASAYQI